MEHLKVINEILRDVYFDEGMSEDDCNKYESIVLELMGKTKQDLNDEINVGISNGYSVDAQMNLFKN